MKAVIFTLLTCAVFAGSGPLPAQASPPAPTVPAGEATDGVRRILDEAVLAGARWPRIRDVVADLRRAYDSAGTDRLWLQGGRPTPQALEVLKVISNVATAGLSPADYDVAPLDSLVQRLGNGATEGEQVRFEATLSVAAARVLSSLQWGRVSPSDVHENFRISRIDYDLAAAVVGAARAANPSLVFDGAEPRLRQYRLLKAALAKYRALAMDTVPFSLPAIRKVTAGDPYAAASALRRRLTLVGDLVPDSTYPPPEADTIYTEELAQAVRNFQLRHGADADGIIGPATRAELERPFTHHISQIELALERWRWLPREFASRVIMVNVPEFRLYAFDRLTSDTTDVFNMDVVVGDAYDNKTPIFMKDLEYLVFAPYWEVPPSIMVKEIRPKAVADPSYLSRNGYVLARGYSQNPPTVPHTPENIAQIGRAIRVRQLPGKGNSLGRVKFMLPNRHNIYLHDTPVQQAFSRYRRDISHGCIRLADPVRLAAWVLRDLPDWTPERLDEALNRTEPLNVPLTERIPVLIVYASAVVDQDQGVRFFPDIYKHDRALAQLLARGYPYTR